MYDWWERLPAAIQADKFAILISRLEAAPTAINSIPLARSFPVIIF
jgi:hypothetical protein